MKEQFVGDINDFHKYRLLRLLSDEGRTKIGVCWMMTPPDALKDGNRVGYLQKPERWRHLDPTLFDLLRATSARSGMSRISQIEAGVLPSAIYQTDVIPDSLQGRANYMRMTWERFKAVDLVFFDPDNGIEVSKPKGRKDSSKYIYWDEIEETYRRGHSVLIYQHFDRQPRKDFVAKRCREIAKRLVLSDIWLFRTPHVLFLLVVHQRHIVKLCHILEGAAARLGADIDVRQWKKGDRGRSDTTPRNSEVHGINGRRWVGPFKLADLLAHTIDGSIPLPPHSRSVYLLSRHAWSSHPSEECMLLYVGGNTGQSERFRARIGDLLANLFGFFGDKTRRHSGGKRLHEWCREHQINPLTLHIAWVDGCSCHRCLEVELFQELKPLLNRVAPSTCSAHGKSVIAQNHPRVLFPPTR